MSEDLSEPHSTSLVTAGCCGTTRDRGVLALQGVGCQGLKSHRKPAERQVLAVYAGHGQGAAASTARAEPKELTWSIMMAAAALQSYWRRWRDCQKLPDGLEPRRAFPLFP